MGLINIEYCGKRYGLQKTAVSKWKMMQAGLSDEDKQKLDNYRISRQQELNSIAQGNNNIAKRLGYSVVKSFLPDGITDKQILEAVNRDDKDTLGFLLALYGGGAATHSRRSNIGYDKNYIIKDLTKDRYKILERAANTLPDKTIYYIPSVNLKSRYKYDGIDPLWYKFQDELNKRHEMLEAISQEKSIAKGRRSVYSTLLYPSKYAKPKSIGGHAHISVLANEARFLNQMHHPEYGDRTKQYRRLSGEADVLGRNAGLDYRTRDIYSRPLTLGDYRRMQAFRGGLSTISVENRSDSDLPVYSRQEGLLLDPVRHTYVPK